MPWFVVVTNPGREQWGLAQASLADEGLEVYAPLCREADGARSPSKALKTSVMFPWYLMVWKPSRTGGWLDVDRAWGVDGVLRLNHQLPPVPLADGVVEELRAMANHEGVVELAPRFKSGQGLRITRGLFAGAEGIVSQKAGKRIGVLMRFFGAEREVNLDEGDVEPVVAAGQLVAA